MTRRGTSKGRRKPAVAGYESGADAPLRATDLALERATAARSVVLVEGISDQIAIEAAATRLGRDLAAEGVVVVPAGGVGSIGALAARFGPTGAGLRLSGLCDLAEVTWVCRALVKAGAGFAQTREDLQRLGFYVCDRDLEDELIRAVGVEAVAVLLAEHGDLAAFQTLQRQAKWKDAALSDQIRRFLGAGARRKLRYAGLFVAALDLERMPLPLRDVLGRA
ncbi:MAG: TOPRIM nucleotidyl transferase/hydrolase domain-containing protein [bacterium]